MDRLANLTLRDIATSLNRYRPVVVTIVVLLLMLSVLPGPRFGRPDATAGFEGATFQGRRATARAPGPVATTTPPPPDTSPIGVASPDVAPTFSPPAPTTSRSPSSFSGGAGFATPEAEGGAVAEADESGAPETAFKPTDPASLGVPTSVARELAVVVSGWGTVTAGTPLSAQQVPPQSLPVGKRVGQDDKRSYVRLAGSGATLRLQEDPEGSRTTTGAISIQACRITVDNWSEGGDKPFSEVPHDPQRCVLGTRASDGTWAFDLSAYDDRADTKGFALVPAPGSSVDFQVAFKL